jgi:hypothetical protein
MSECSIDARTHLGYVDEREVIMDGIYFYNSPFQDIADLMIF